MTCDDPKSTAIECGRCRVTFPVRERFDYGPQPETTRCAEHGCGRRYWHSAHDDKRAGKAGIGVWSGDPAAHVPGDDGYRVDLEKLGRDPAFP